VILMANDENRTSAEVVGFKCPHCEKVIKEIRYEDHGYVSFPHITDEHSSEENYEWPVRKFFCPECGEEIDYEDLVNAGAVE